MKESLSLTLCRQYLGQEVEVKIDRPLNSLHPKHGFKYEVNYGFIPGVMAPDGEELDAYFLGVDQPLKIVTGKCIAIIHRLKDNDDKLVVVPIDRGLMTDEEISKSINFQEQWFEHEIIR
jgi:inorganic pyrophosphatase